MTYVKPLFFVGSARDDLIDFPDELRRTTGYALYLAQLGEKHPHAKPLKGFGGAGVLEVVEQYDGDAFRTVYTSDSRTRSTSCTHFGRSRRMGFRRRLGISSE